MFLDEVADTIREVATEEVVARFRSLSADDISEKSPGDLVTIADRECERVLTDRLRLIRDVPVVGEESTAADPSLLDLIDTAPAVWIVDPVDGTKNFAKGSPNYAVMVAYVEAGRTEASWIWQPEPDIMHVAQRGHGATRNGEPLVRASAPDRTGIIKRGYLSAEARDRLKPPPPAIGVEIDALRCAGIEYAMLAEGTIDFLFYYRTWPWDHAPGTLLAEEAGVHVARIDGSDYGLGGINAGLLSAVDEVWSPLASHIAPAIDGE